jgi:uncharacterized protein (DUF2236 family)
MKNHQERTAFEKSRLIADLDGESAGLSGRERADDEQGYFPPGSAIRKTTQEALGLLGGGRAVLLQLAHPLVAAGVAEHSDFQADPLTRLLGTLQLIHTLVFGTRRQVDHMLGRFHAMHAPVRGRLAQAAGRFPAGTPYDASDPELMLWVHATLVDTAIVAYERFVKPLPPQQWRLFYAQTRVLAGLMGIPEEIVPPTLAGFRGYMAETLASDTLAVTNTSSQLAREVLHPQGVGFVPAASARLLRFVTAGLLPRRFRRPYGLAWGPGRQRALDALGWTTRRLRPVVPAWVWQSPLLGNGLARLLLWGAAKGWDGERPA